MYRVRSTRNHCSNSWHWRWSFLVRQSGQPEGDHLVNGPIANRCERELTQDVVAVFVGVVAG